LRYSVNVRLPEAAYDALVTIAERELRDPRDQAARFVLDGLRRKRALPTEPPPDHRPPAAVEAGT
jgi:hypothetical protein